MCFGGSGQHHSSSAHPHRRPSYLWRGHTHNHTHTRPRGGYTHSQTVFSISKSVESLDIFTGRCVSMQCSAEEWHVSAGGGEAQCHHIGHRQSGLPPISGLPASAVPHYLASFKLIQRPLSHLIYTRRKLFTRELFSLFFLFILLHL